MRQGESRESRGGRGVQDRGREGGREGGGKGYVLPAPGLSHVEEKAVNSYHAAALEGRGR